MAAIYTRRRRKYKNVYPRLNCKINYNRAGPPENVLQGFLIINQPPRIREKIDGELSLAQDLFMKNQRFEQYMSKIYEISVRVNSARKEEMVIIWKRSEEQERTISWEWFAQMDAYQLNIAKSKICKTALRKDLARRVDELKERINDKVERFHAMGQPLKLYYIDLDGKEARLPFREAHLLQIDEMNHILEEIKFNKNENVIRFRDILIKMLLKDEEAGILTGPVLSKDFEEEFHRFPKLCQGYPKYESENIGLIYQEGDREEKVT